MTSRRPVTVANEAKKNVPLTLEQKFPGIEKERVFESYGKIYLNQE
jgi:hypothetical protein|tara:strand:- start:310 stop:447 length:138 start_codon:yes stop_codon:yes gene_type:complete